MWNLNVVENEKIYFTWFPDHKWICFTVHHDDYFVSPIADSDFIFLCSYVHQIPTGSEHLLLIKLAFVCVWKLKVQPTNEQAWRKRTRKLKWKMFSFQNNILISSKLVINVLITCSLRKSRKRHPFGLWIAAGAKHLANLTLRIFL